MEAASGERCACRTPRPWRCGVEVCTIASALGASEERLYTAWRRGEGPEVRESGKGFQQERDPAGAVYLDGRRKGWGAGTRLSDFNSKQTWTPGSAVELPGLECLTVLPGPAGEGILKYVATPESRVLRVGAGGGGSVPQRPLMNQKI
ncbi:hypothetical protein VULLAG_LOCUS9725 [Vulpes lagopus]